MTEDLSILQPDRVCSALARHIICILLTMKVSVEDLRGETCASNKALLCVTTLNPVSHTPAVVDPSGTYALESLTRGTADCGYVS
jgi:hypothetical protein